MPYTLHQIPNPPLKKGRGKRTAPPTEIAIHNTANDATAKAEAEYVANGNGEVSYHFAVDEKEVWQVMPINYMASHAGTVTATNRGNIVSIGIEIARSMDYATDNYAQAELNAIEVTAKLMKEYNIPLDKVKRHYDYSGKKCPHRMFEANPRTWEEWKALLKEEFDRINRSGAVTAPAPSAGGAKAETIYRIQAGSFSIRANAEAFLERVRMRFPDAFIAESIANGTKMNRVQVGAFSIKKNADNFLKKVKQYFPDAFITSTTQSVMVDYVALAKEVIRGDWGNGQARVDSLTKAGYDAAKVQAEVERQLRG